MQIVCRDLFSVFIFHPDVQSPGSTERTSQEKFFHPNFATVGSRLLAFLMASLSIRLLKDNVFTPFRNVVEFQAPQLCSHSLEQQSS